MVKERKRILEDEEEEIKSIVGWWLGTMVMRIMNSH